MPRSYRHIKEYETEIFGLKEQGLTNREIGKKFGLTKEQIEQFFNRHNAKLRKLAAGIALKKKGRLSKDSVVTDEDKITELRYKLSRKDAQIKQLEMENELIRDFLSLTERK